MATLPQTSLYYRSGSSDKVYHIRIEEAGSLYVVNFAYGRRLGTLQTGTKTDSPVSLPWARRIFDQVVSEKIGKGYSVGTASATFASPTPTKTARATVTGYLPQLLNQVTEEEALALLRDEQFCVQEKYDGERMILRKAGAEVTAYNKKGQVKAVAPAIADRAREIPGDFALDGEVIGERYHAFDLLEQGRTDCRLMSFQDRYAKLAGAPDFRAFNVAATAFSAPEKLALFERLKAEKREGLVFKKTTARYTPGRPASGGDQLKYKFYATASVRVALVNEKRSVAVEVLDPTLISGIDNIISGTGGTWIGVGNVTIPVNAAVPAVGDVVEVRYLYAYRGGSLFQSVYLGPRNDVSAEECLVSQLKYKTEEED